MSTDKKVIARLKKDYKKIREENIYFYISLVVLNAVFTLCMISIFLAPFTKHYLFDGLFAGTLFLVVPIFMIRKVTKRLENEYVVEELQRLKNNQ